jgi:hypothetical protein
MNQRIARTIQIIGELAIPLLGYFFWNWSFSFILFFYIIENLFLLYFRIETIQNVKSTILKAKRIVDIKLLLFFLGLWIVEFALIHFLLKIIATNKNLMNAWQDFFLFEDMGVPQGFILIPLLYFASRMKMKQDIVIEIKKINTKLDLDKLKISALYNWIAISFWGLLIGLNVLFALPEIWNILLTLILLLFRAFQRI